MEKIKVELKIFNPIHQNKVNLDYLSVKFYQMIKTRFPNIKKCPIIVTRSFNKNVDSIPFGFRQ